MGTTREPFQVVHLESFTSHPAQKRERETYVRSDKSKFIKMHKNNEQIQRIIGPTDETS